MKEVTYEEWMKNPTPRMMLVWDDDETCMEKMKVIYVVSNQSLMYHVVALSDNDKDLCRYKHCAEMLKTRRMTNKELSRWLRENPTRELKINDYIYHDYNYRESEQDAETGDLVLIRENDGEWKEPLVEEE